MASLDRGERVGAPPVAQRVKVMRQHRRRELGFHDARRAAEKRRLADPIRIFGAADGRHRRLAIDAEIPRQILARRRQMIGLNQRHRDRQPQQTGVLFERAAGRAQRVRAHVRYAIA